MNNSLSLLVAVVVSLQCLFEASAQESRNVIGSNLQPKVSSPKRRLGNALRIEITPPTTVQFEPGTRTVLKCKVLGRPTPTVQWMKNGESVSYEEQPNDILPVDPVMAAYLVSKLVVTSALPGDVFTCVATSGAKRTSASTTVISADDNDEENLFTLEKLFRMPSKPIITEYYSDVFQHYGADLLLPCRVNSFTKLQVFWQFNEESIYGNPRFQVLPSGDLLVSDLKWDDMGNFTCIAKNMYGRDVATTFVYPVKA